MKTSPPNDVGIWAAFSVSNCGYRAPKPSASAPIANVSPQMVTSSITIMNGRTWSSTLVKPVRSSARTRSGIVPTQYLDQSSARRSSGLERRSHIPALERYRRKNEAGGDGGQHEPRQPEVEERDERDVEEPHRLTAVQRQRLDVEQVHQHERRQQDELAPLRRVAEEQLDVLDHELALGDREEAQQRSDRAAPHLAPHEPFGPLLRFREPRRKQVAVEHRAKRDEGRRRTVRAGRGVAPHGRNA